MRARSTAINRIDVMCCAASLNVVATRSQHLGPGGPEERWWRAFTTYLRQPAPEGGHSHMTNH